MSYKSSKKNLKTSKFKLTKNHVTYRNYKFCYIKITSNLNSNPTITKLIYVRNEMFKLKISFCIIILYNNAKCLFFVVVIKISIIRTCEISAQSLGTYFIMKQKVMVIALQSVIRTNSSHNTKVQQNKLTAVQSIV